MRTPTVAFVGKLIAIRALPDPCENEPEPADGSMACITFEVYELVRKGVMAARGVALPPL